MNLSHGDVEITGDERGAVVSNFREESALHLDADALRWLLLIAGPAVLCEPAPPEPEEVPSDAPETVDGQIPGQTTIDEALAS